jgi:ABC-type nitrate/sulfonate/bicarbonate transport system permease component
MGDLPAPAATSRPQGLENERKSGRGRLLTPARVRRMSSLLTIVVAWELYARISASRLTPSTLAILDRLYSDIVSGQLWFHAQITLYRGFTGLAFALVFGVAVGIAMARSRWLDAALNPFLAVLYPIPKLSLYPVAILILGFGAASKIWQAGLECFFPIAYNAYAGARAVDRNYLALARNAGASRRHVLKDVIAPSMLPSILTGLRIAMPIMLIVITVTELLGESRGLGFLIRDAQARFNADRALAVVLVLGVLGFLLDRIIVWVTNRVVFWERGVQV